MARFRRRRIGRRGNFYARNKRGHNSTKQGMGGLIFAGAYGAGRSYLATLMSPLSAKIPFGAIADEIVLMTTLGLTRKFVKNPMVNKICTVGMYIEAAQIGQAIASGQVSMSTTSSNGNGALIATVR